MDRHRLSAADLTGLAVEARAVAERVVASSKLLSPKLTSNSSEDVVAGVPFGGPSRGELESSLFGSRIESSSSAVVFGASRAKLDFESVWSTVDVSSGRHSVSAVSEAFVYAIPSVAFDCTAAGGASLAGMAGPGMNGVVKSDSTAVDALSSLDPAETRVPSGRGGLSSRCAGQQLVPIVVDGQCDENVSSEYGRDRSNVSCDNKKASSDDSAARHAGGEWMWFSGHVSS